MYVSDGTNSLKYAVKDNTLDIFKILLDKGADPKEKVNHGLTPMMIATQEGKYETAKLLIEHGANIDDHENLSGNVPLHLAISCRQLRILMLLIENGTSIDCKALDGATAWTYAVNNKQREMAEFLVENGANVYSTSI